MTDRDRRILRTTQALGATYAIAGFHHGVFEALQGAARTPGFFIDSIGPKHVRWEFGTDGALTVLPTFLATGLVAMGLSAAILVWLFSGLKGRHGADGLLLLFCLLALSGGGIGFIPFFLTAWAWDRFLRRRHAAKAPFVPMPGVGRLWLPALVLSVGLFLIVLELSVFGFPFATIDGATLMAAIALLLLASYAALHLAYVAAATARQTS